MRVKINLFCFTLIVKQFIEKLCTSEVEKVKDTVKNFIMIF